MPIAVILFYKVIVKVLGNLSKLFSYFRVRVQNAHSLLSSLLDVIGKDRDINQLCSSWIEYIFLVPQL